MPLADYPWAASYIVNYKYIGGYILTALILGEALAILHRNIISIPN